MNFKRFLAHTFASQRLVRKYFSKDDLSRITDEIASSEEFHNAELVFAIEPGISPILAFKDYPARDRAIRVFSDLGVWDTEENNGVMIYLLLADHDIEIVADRGVDKLAGQEYWESVCKQIEDSFRRGEFTEGVIEGIREITSLLKKHYPKTKDNPNELPNRPVIL